mmetsp:Transcript_412/g.816  ORF Transcript_412/g.816 Transcript_412/m.816 type:complete len:309 (-) Transcript_412:67-993(-)
MPPRSNCTSCEDPQARSESSPCQKRRAPLKASTETKGARESGSKNTAETEAHMKSSEHPERSLSESRALQGVIERVLKERIEANDKRRDLDNLVSSFHGFKPPAISATDYVRRLFSYSYCSPACFTMAMFYIDRLTGKQSRREFCITSLNVHRIFLTAALLAVKFSEDVSYDNEHFARVGGVSLKELNRLELSMLAALDYRLSISKEDFSAYETKLVDECVSYLDAEELASSKSFSPVSRRTPPACDLYFSGDVSRVTSASSSSSAMSRASSCDPLRVALGDAGFLSRIPGSQAPLSPVSSSDRLSPY